jgi:uncharacterized membrane protein
MSAQRFHPQSL